MTNDRAHWEQVYRTKPPAEVSWFQSDPALSLRLIETAVPDRAAPLIDVGGGASVLGARLLEVGYRDVTVLDISPAALAAARARMGTDASHIHWIEADIRQAALDPGRYALWHDRAVFHFLTSPEDRAVYLRQLRLALSPGGMVVIVTFAEDGPSRCSGLEVRRYSAQGLAEELGDGFLMVRSEREEHRTPGGTPQLFTYGVFRWMGGVRPAWSREDGDSRGSG